LVRLGKPKIPRAPPSNAAQLTPCARPKVLPITPKATPLSVNLEITLRDFWSIFCASWQEFERSGSASFSEFRAKARFSASSFCALTLRTAGRLLRLLVKPRSSYRKAAVLAGAIGLLGWQRSRRQRIDRCRRRKLSAAFKR